MQRHKFRKPNSNLKGSTIMIDAYLAGFEVFSKDAVYIGEQHKRICQKFLTIGHYPLDNTIHASSKEECARLIFEGNLELIHKSQLIIANLNNFRGSSDHPSSDSGTLWETGYGAAIGKIVIGYASDVSIIPTIVKDNILLIQANSFEECLEKLDELKTLVCDTKPPHLDDSDQTFYLDPKYPDISDCDAEASFMVGYCYGKGLQPKVVLSDKRNQIEKFGPESHGYMVEDFDQPCNLMIYCSSNIL